MCIKHQHLFSLWCWHTLGCWHTYGSKSSCYCLIEIRSQMKKDFHKITEKKTGNQGAYQRISLFSWNSRSGWLFQLSFFFWKWNFGLEKDPVNEYIVTIRACNVRCSTVSHTHKISPEMEVAPHYKMLTMLTLLTLLTLLTWLRGIKKLFFTFLQKRGRGAKNPYQKKNQNFHHFLTIFWPFLTNFFFIKWEGGGGLAKSKNS